MPTRRTTVAADADDLAVLEQEAARRGVSLTEVLRDAVAAHADALRAARRPRFGLGDSGGRGPGAAGLGDEAPITAAGGGPASSRGERRRSRSDSSSPASKRRRAR